MTKAEVGLETMEEYLIGIEETVDLGIEVHPCLGVKVKGEGVITVENEVNKANKKHKMQHLVEVAEGSWLGSWPETMLEEVEDQIDTFEVY